MNQIANRFASLIYGTLGVAMSIYKLFSKATLIGCVGLALNTGATAQSVEIPPDKPGKIGEIIDNLMHLRSYLNDRAENRKATKAIDAERAKISPGETRTFEVVTTGGPLMAGGKFVRVQEAKAGPKLSEPGLYVSAPFSVGGGLPIPGNELTPAQRKEMQERAEIAKKEEQTLKAAEEAAKQLEEVRNAAEKARAELEAAQAAAAQAAAAKAAAAQAAAAQAAAAKAAEARAAAAAKAEREAERNGREVQREINRERERYKKEGGPYRMPG